MFKIEIIKPKPVIQLDFVLTEYPERYKVILELTDGKGRNTVLNLNNSKTYVPSTILARWCNFYLADELKTLAGKGSTVSYKRFDRKFNPEEFEFRPSPVKYFGLHDVIGKKGKVLSTTIDDSIGMKKVVAILEGLGYSVETFFDTESNRMTRIRLVKES